MTQSEDSATLSGLYAQFINNFLKQDVPAHNKITYKDIMRVKCSGIIVYHDEHLKNRATDFDNNDYISFSHEDKLIKIFGNMVLVRAKTVHTKK